MDLLGQTPYFLLKGVQWSGLSIHHSFLLHPVDESSTEYLNRRLYCNDNHYIPSYAGWMRPCGPVNVEALLTCLDI
jgi:hypothetical protein